MCGSELACAVEITKVRAVFDLIFRAHEMIWSNQVRTYEGARIQLKIIKTKKVPEVCKQNYSNFKVYPVGTSWIALKLIIKRIFSKNCVD